MYYVYMLHDENVPVYDARWTLYRYVKAISGSKVESIFVNHRVGLLYAMRTPSMIYEDGKEAWVFSDKLFE